VLAVKIDNLAPARPQTGLAGADIVYVLPVEGGLSRFLAVFSSHFPPVIGPVRSAREDDLELLRQFGRPAFAYSGAQPQLLPVVERARTVDLYAGRALGAGRPDRDLHPVVPLAFGSAAFAAARVAWIERPHVRPRRTEDEMSVTTTTSKVYQAPGRADSPVEVKPRYENFIGGHWVPPVQGQYMQDLSYLEASRWPPPPRHGQMSPKDQDLRH
jgi:Protein of unknown function (DUF3048) N-terminal domain